MPCRPPAYVRTQKLRASCDRSPRWSTPRSGSRKAATSVALDPSTRAVRRRRRPRVQATRGARSWRLPVDAARHRLWTAATGLLERGGELVKHTAELELLNLEPTVDERAAVSHAAEVQSGV